MITINLEKAKNIWRNKIRTERLPVLDSLDILYIRALETGDTQKQNAIIRKKQILRDAPSDSRISNAKNIDELKTIDPIKEIENE
jgi:hypothetical protein